MVKPARRLEDALEQVRQVRTEGATAEALRPFLAHRHGLVVARAAKVAGEHGLTELAADLGAALTRLLAADAKADVGCAAKQALAEALVQLGCGDDALYHEGMRHVQHEPVWGGTVDAAAALRGVCAMGLAASYDPDTLDALAELLADPEPAARAGAARAIAAHGQAGASSLLRFKVTLGDEDDRVWADCAGALLALGAQTVPFVARYLSEGNPAQREAAAFELARSRYEEALPPLFRWYEEARGAAARRLAITAISTVRLPPAEAFLLEEIREGAEADACAAIDALSVYGYDAGLRGRVVEAAGARLSAYATKAFEGL